MTMSQTRDLPANQPMILVAGANLDDVEAAGAPPFVKDGCFDLSSVFPRRFRKGDVPVYSQRSNATFVYIGLLHNAVADPSSRSLRFSRYEPFHYRVVAYDKFHSIDRTLLYEPNKGWGPHAFNYITPAAQEAI